MNDIYGFLKRRDLSEFNPFRRPPMTEAKRQIITESEHPLHTYIIDAVVSGHFRRELGAEFSFDALARQLSKDGYGTQAKNTKEVGTALRLAGATHVRKTVGDQKVRMYVLPASEDEGTARTSNSDVSKSFSTTPAYPVRTRTTVFSEVFCRPGPEHLPGPPADPLGSSCTQALGRPVDVREVKDGVSLPQRPIAEFSTEPRAAFEASVKFQHQERKTPGIFLPGALFSLVFQVFRDQKLR